MKTLGTVARGFGFGMLLQIAIGPVCLFILQTSIAQGLGPALTGVLGTALTDGAEILLAALGVGAALKHRPGLQRVMKYFGAAVLFLFGADGVLGFFGRSLFFHWELPAAAGGVFLKTVLLALANPLTVLFWAGVFAAKIANEKMTGRSLAAFGSGCVLSTLFFLSAVALVGSVARPTLPEMVVRLFGLLVGVSMFFFAFRTLLKRAEGEQEE